MKIILDSSPIHGETDDVLCLYKKLLIDLKEGFLDDVYLEYQDYKNNIIMRNGSESSIASANHSYKPKYKKIKSFSLFFQEKINELCLA